MSKITVAFIKAAMVYFVLAMLLGIHMSRTGAVYPSMPVHVHFNLLGWISMMVYGVAYHILPRFSGQPLWNEKLSVWHFWLANIGLVGMALGWILIGGPGGGAILYIFALVEGVSIICFAMNMFNTVKAAPAVPPRPPVRPRTPKPEAKPPAASAPQPKAEAGAPEGIVPTTGTKAKKKPAKARKKAKPAAKTVKKEEKEEKKEEGPKEALPVSETVTKTETTDTKESGTDSAPVEAATPKETESTSAPATAAEPEAPSTATGEEEEKETPKPDEGAD